MIDYSKNLEWSRRAGARKFGAATDTGNTESIEEVLGDVNTCCTYISRIFGIFWDRGVSTAMPRFAGGLGNTQWGKAQSRERAECQRRSARSQEGLYFRYV